MIKMEELRSSFSSMGFTDVKTLLNSGNVIFMADETDMQKVTKTIAAGLEKQFSVAIGVMVRTSESLKQIVSENPFAHIAVTDVTRLYVTFLSGSTKSPLKIPYQSPEKDFAILQISQNAIFSVLTLTEKTNTTKAMGIIEKEFGKNVTTRNWNTVKKCAAA